MMLGKVITRMAILAGSMSVTSELLQKRLQASETDIATTLKQFRASVDLWSAELRDLEAIASQPAAKAGGQ